MLETGSVGLVETQLFFFFFSPNAGRKLPIFISPYFYQNNMISCDFIIWVLNRHYLTYLWRKTIDALSIYNKFASEMHIPSPGFRRLLSWSKCFVCLRRVGILKLLSARGYKADLIKWPTKIKLTFCSLFLVGSLRKLDCKSETRGLWWSYTAHLSKQICILNVEVSAKFTALIDV